MKADELDANATAERLDDLELVRMKRLRDTRVRELLALRVARHRPAPTELMFSQERRKT